MKIHHLIRQTAGLFRKARASARWRMAWRKPQKFVRQIAALLRRALAAARNKRTVRIAFRVAGGIALFPVVFALFLVFYIQFDRTHLPDLAGFVRFEPPTMGHVYDANGHVLIELGRERREILRYEKIPAVVRNAVLSAEDKNFFSHSGLDYSAFLRLLAKTNVRAMAAQVTPFDSVDLSKDPRVFPQGGSTITQQLVRGYFLPRLSASSQQHAGILPPVLAFFIGVQGTNKLLLKIETMRLSLWIEEAMRKEYGSKRRAKEEIFARYASFVYLGKGRYGFAAAADYYFDKRIESFTASDADKAALLAAIPKSPGEYAPTAENLQKPTRRRNQILSLMVKNNFLPAEAAAELKLAPIRLAVHAAIEPVEAPAAVQATLEELKRLAPQLGPAIGVNRLLDGHIQIHTTVDRRIQRIANLALENGLKAYERRHPHSKGLIQGSVVVLRNSDSAILAESGGRQVYQGRNNTYSDFNRASQSKRQPGSAMKPFVYLAAFRRGTLNLETIVPDEPISVAGASSGTIKWINNFDNQFQGMIPARQALAESRNAATVWVASRIGMDAVLKTALDMGIHSQLQPYVSTALGASEVTLLELANAYRLLAGGRSAEPYIIREIQRTRGEIIYVREQPCCLAGSSSGLWLIQEGLRGAVRIPSGTAHALASFPIPVMGKTGTTNSYRDALFVGSTFGPNGITVAVRIGFDDNRSLGARETGARAAMPVFREIVLKIYQEELVAPAPRFPEQMEENITAYLRGDFKPVDEIWIVYPATAESAEPGPKPAHQLPAFYPSTNSRGRVLFRNQ